MNKKETLNPRRILMFWKSKKLEQALEVARDSIRDLQKKNNEQQEEIQQLKAIRNHDAITIEELQQTIATLSQINEGAEQEQTRLKEDLEKQKRKIQELGTEKHELTFRLKEETARYAELRQQKIEADKKQGAYKAELQIHDKARKELTDSLTKAQKDLEEAEQQVQSQGAKLVAALRDMEEVREKLTATEILLQDANKKLMEKSSEYNYQKAKAGELAMTVVKQARWIEKVIECRSPLLELMQNMDNWKNQTEVEAKQKLIAAAGPTSQQRAAQEYENLTGVPPNWKSMQVGGVLEATVAPAVSSGDILISSALDKAEKARGKPAEQSPREANETEEQ